MASTSDLTGTSASSSMKKQQTQAHLLEPSDTAPITSLRSDMASDMVQTLSQPVMHRNATSSRARTSSIGADMRSVTSKRARAGSVTPSDAPYDLHSAERGPGTPDFTLDRFANVRSVRDQRNNGISGLRNSMTTKEQHERRAKDRDDAHDDEEDQRRTAFPGADVKRTYPTRPRFSTQIRSFFSSLTGEASGSGTTMAAPKARSSFDVGRIGGASSAEKFQGLAASAQSLQYGAKGVPQRPHPLAMPSARQAGPDGLRGLNDDSPPLTPAASDERDSVKDYQLVVQQQQQIPLLPSSARLMSSRNDEHGIDQANDSVDRSSLWSPFSTASMTISTSSSGRASPVSSHFGANSILVPPSRSPTSTMASSSAKMASGGLLPSHMLSPPSSPEPHGRHQGRGRSLVRGNQQEFTSSRMLESISASASAMVMHMQTFFFAAKMPPLRPHLPALFFLMTAFVGSTVCILLALSTLPLHLPSHITDLTLAEIRDMSMSLREYSRSSNQAFVHTLAVLGAFFTWKQAFTVPGSIIMNVVFGAMYGTWFGTLYTSLLTAFGGMLCYLLMAPLGPFISAMPGLSKGLQKMRKALQGNLNAPSRPSTALTSNWQPTGLAADDLRIRGHPDRRGSNGAAVRRPSKKYKASQKPGKNNNLWSYLLVLRLLPVVPYGLMNIACSVLRVPLLPYTVTLGLGSIPWNACTVQIGDLLVEVVSALPATIVSSDVADQLGTGEFVNAPDPMLAGGAGALAPLQSMSPALKVKAQSGLRAISDKVWNREMMFKLVLMSVVSLAPMLIQRWLKRRHTDNDAEEEEELLAEQDAHDVLGMNSMADRAGLAEENGSDFGLHSEEDGDETIRRAAELPSGLLNVRTWRASWQSGGDRSSSSMFDSFVPSSSCKRHSTQKSSIGDEHRRTPPLKRAVARTIV